MTMDRKSRIRTLLFDNGQMPLADLADAIGASLPTLRRDLTEMETAGLVERLHGSARIADAARTETAFEAREQTAIGAKRAIAARAAQDLIPGSAIFLDAGTTVLQLARLIRLSAQRLTVFTNGLAVAQELAHAPGVSLTLLGGRLRHENLSMVGPLAETMLHGLWFDHLFLGSSALSDDARLTSYDADEARLNGMMVQRAAKITILADGTKFGTRATYAVHSLTGVEQLICEVAPKGALGQKLSALGTKVILARKAGHD